MNRELFVKYAELEANLRVIEEAKLKLKQELLTEMQKEKADIVEIDTGSFSLVHRKTWTYSPAVAALTRGLAEAKKDEERRKIASYEENLTVMYRPKNYEDNL